MNSLLLLFCNVFRRLRLGHHLETTFDKVNYFRIVRLLVIYKIVLWITGLKLWVICVSTFDFLLSHDQHEHTSELLVPLSFQWLLVNGCCFRYSINFLPVNELTWCSSFQPIFARFWAFKARTSWSCTNLFQIISKKPWIPRAPSTVRYLYALKNSI